MQPNEEKKIITLSSGTDVSNPITNTVRDCKFSAFWNEMLELLKLYSRKLERHKTRYSNESTGKINYLFACARKKNLIESMFENIYNNRKYINKNITL
jgi:hypothetical protein